MQIMALLTWVPSLSMGREGAACLGKTMEWVCGGDNPFMSKMLYQLLPLSTMYSMCKL